jgi:hypothetical protein
MPSEGIWNSVQEMKVYIIKKLVKDVDLLERAKANIAYRTRTL